MFGKIIDGVTFEIRGNTGVLSIEEETLKNKDTMGKINEFMDAWQDAMIEEEKKIAEQFKVSSNTAAAIQYLRTRSRWTQEKENELIERDHQGNPIDLGTVLCGNF